MQELSTSGHPHILEFKEAFLTSKYLAFVMEYVEGETLERFLEKVGGSVIEGLARFIFQQLLLVVIFIACYLQNLPCSVQSLKPLQVDFCHRNNKILRDIKLSNILLAISEKTLPVVKLCDFSVTSDLIRDADLPSLVSYRKT